MLTGTVIWYNPVKGLGFINPDQGGDDVFVHMSALKASGLKVVKEGDMITYELLLDEKIFDHGFKFRSMVLPDTFLDQDTPKNMYENAAMSANDIEEKVFDILDIVTLKKSI